MIISTHICTDSSAEDMLSALAAGQQDSGWLLRVERQEPVILAPEERVARRCDRRNQPPRTLREARRLVARVQQQLGRSALSRDDDLSYDDDEWAELGEALLPVIRGCALSPYGADMRQWIAAMAEAARILDRAISLLGPDAPLSYAAIIGGGSDSEEEERGQNQAEARPSAPPADAEADDSAADEAEAQPAEQAGQPGDAPRAGDADGGETAEGDDPDRAEAEGAPRQATEPEPDGEAGGGSIPSAEDAEPAPESEHDYDAGENDAGESYDAGEDDDIGESYDTGEGDDIGESDESVLPELTRQGGRGTDYEVADTSYLRLRAVLRRLRGVSVRCAPRTTPRWDHRALVREITSRRYALMRARRWDTPPSGVIVITDHSGSCDRVSAELEAAARDLSSLPGVVVAPTAVYYDDLPEGVIVPERLYGDRALVSRLRRVLRYPAVSVADWRAIAGVGITHALVLGDVHGHYCYEAARDAGVLVLWCDPNGDRMPVEDTRGMLYEVMPTRMGVQTALSRTIERLIERASAQTTT